MGKEAKSLDEQIQILRDRGMILDCGEDKVKEHLLDIGYYRLGFYWFPFEKDNNSNDRKHCFVPDTKFSTIIDLYYLDVDLRHLLIKHINRIEINFRTKLVYYVSNKYKNSPVWFADSKVMKRNFINSFDDYYNDNFRRNKVIENHHRNNINDKYAPAWKTLEHFTFGTNFLIYKSLLENDMKKIISNCYGINDVDKFIKIIQMIVFVRNYCAHSGVMFDLRNTYGIPKLPFYQFNNKDRHCLDSCIKVIIYILSKISQNRANELEQDLKNLFKKNAENPIIKNIIETKINYIY
ncbi:Abi family protein [Capnocytophaga canimorsus]